MNSGFPCNQAVFNNNKNNISFSEGRFECGQRTGLDMWKGTLVAARPTPHAHEQKVKRNGSPFLLLNWQTHLTHKRIYFNRKDEPEDPDRPTHVKAKSLFLLIRANTFSRVTSGV